MGFEPTRRDHRPAAFRERSLRPLGYISRYVYPPENGKNWRIEQQEQDVSKSPGSRINKGFSSIPLLKNLLDFEADPHTLEVHVSRLRERFRDNPDFEIVTVRGLGYKAVKKQ